MQVLSAKPGLGKSSYSNAMACAIASCGGGVLICCEQMEGVDQRYRDLERLMTGRVACYSTDHMKGNKPTKVLKPAAQFTKEELANCPVIVTTHEGMKRDDARAFKDWLPNADLKLPAPRDLVIVDEMVKEIQQYAIDLQAVEGAKAAVEVMKTDAPHHAVAGLIYLETFLQARIGASVTWRPPMDLLADEDAREIRSQLAWFDTREAEEFAQRAKHKSIAPVFGYAACLHRGWAYTTTYGNETVLMGYHNGLDIDMPMLQLDGTSDINGLRGLGLTDREVLPGPSVNYAALDAVIEAPPTRMAIAKYLGSVRNAKTYAKWLDSLIVKHAQPGQKVLVVCKKMLLGLPDTEHAMYAFPTWGEDSAKWARINYTTEFGYTVDARHVAVQWWGGPSAGHNAFQDAEVVILADAQWEPRQKVLADMQGYSRQAPTDAGSPVDEMHKLGGLGAKPRRYEAYKLQAVMASYVQAASRGRLRQWSPDGTCGSQKLVCGLYDTAWLLDGWDTMFPGARRPEVVGSALPAPKRAQASKGKKGRRTGPSAVTLLTEYLQTPGRPGTVTLDDRGGHGDTVDRGPSADTKGCWRYREADRLQAAARCAWSASHVRGSRTPVRLLTLTWIVC
jgi:hypothetical protein